MAPRALLPQRGIQRRVSASPRPDGHREIEKRQRTEEEGDVALTKINGSHEGFGRETQQRSHSSHQAISKMSTI